MPKLSEFLGPDFLQDATLRLVDGVTQRAPGWLDAMSTGGNTATYYPQTTDPAVKVEFPFDDTAYWDTCEFMSMAMERDARSDEAKDIRKRNAKWRGPVNDLFVAAGKMYKDVGSDIKIEGNAFALRDFYDLADHNRPWDYKHILENRGRLIERGYRNRSGRFLGTTIPEDKEYLYFYDLWGNMHFGYVGRSCGFTEETLVNAARADDGKKGLSNTESYTDIMNIQLGSRFFDLGSASPVMITEELKVISKFYTEGVGKYKVEELVNETPATEKRMNASLKAAQD